MESAVIVRSYKCNENANKTGDRQIRPENEHGADWPKVEDVLCTLRGYGIYLLDVHQRNIAFRGT